MGAVVTSDAELDRRYKELIGMRPGVPAIKKEAGMGLKAVNPKVKDIRKPQCPTHHEEMAYEPAIGRWKCPVAVCKFTATRKVTEDDADTDVPLAKSVMPRKAPIPVNTKAMTLVIVESEEEERYTLELKGWAIAVDITDYVETVVDDQTNSVSLVLLFNDVQRR